MPSINVLFLGWKSDEINYLPHSFQSVDKQRGEIHTIRNLILLTVESLEAPNEDCADRRGLASFIELSMPYRYWDSLR